MKGDPDNIIIPDDHWSLDDDQRGPKPAKKAKAVPIKKIAPKMSDLPRDRGSDPARKVGYRDELSAYAGKVGPDTRATRAARHAKPGGIVHGEYPTTIQGSESRGKHGKPWNGKD